MALTLTETATQPVQPSLGGASAVPPSWAETVAKESRLDLQAGGLAMAAVAAEIFAADEVAFGRRRAAVRDLQATHDNAVQVG